jgi:hypothetical protein
MDVAMDMAGGTNPIAEADRLEAVDTDATAVPPFFAFLRPVLCRADGSPRMLVRIMPYCVAYTLVAFVLFTRFLFGTVIPKTGTPMPPLMQIAVSGFAFAFSMPGFFIPLLCHTIKPEGSLQQLGEGEKRVSAKSLRQLRKWVWVSRVVMAGASLFGLQLCLVVFVTLLHLAGAIDDSEGNPMARVGRAAGMETEVMTAVLFLLPGMAVCGGGGYAAMACFFGSLKVAVCLARDDVSEVLKTTKRPALADDTLWADDVARPAIALGTGTMKHLSEGWGTGTGIGFVLCWIVSFTNFLIVVHNITAEAVGTKDPFTEGNNEKYDPTKHGLTCIGMAVAPLFISADVAHVSSMCDTLINKINSLRLEWSTTEEAKQVHARTFPLQCTLKELNNAQVRKISAPTSL